jgi:hypothetical protein
MSRDMLMHVQATLEHIERCPPKCCARLQRTVGLCRRATRHRGGDLLLFCFHHKDMLKADSWRADAARTYHRQVAELKNELHRIRTAAALIIQRRWRHANACPTKVLCIRRLMREFNELAN